MVPPVQGYAPDLLLPRLRRVGAHNMEGDEVAIRWQVGTPVDRQTVGFGCPT